MPREHSPHTSVEQTGGEQKSQRRESSQERKARLIERFIRTRVIQGHDSLDEAEETELAKIYKEKSAPEKAAELYQKMIVYFETVRSEQGKKGTINPKLISRIKILLNDPEVIKLLPSTYGQARIEQKAAHGPGLMTDWQTLMNGINEKKKKLDDLRKQVFQETFKSPDDLGEAKQEIVELQDEVHEESVAQLDIEQLSDREHTPENTDAVAMIQYQKLLEYNRQFTEEGFVWLPSRVEIDTRAMRVLESGNPSQTRKGVFFISEPGTGKTEQIRAIAKRLTGMDRVKISCGPRIGDPQLLGKERVFPNAQEVEQGTFTDYRETASGAWTGYDFSYQTQPLRGHAQMVELDEVTKAFDNDNFFTRLKGFFALRDGDKMPGTDKLVLPGRVIFGSGNVGAHHGNKPIPPALEREFEVIPVDYAEMWSSINPELYEFMLQALMQKGVMPPAREGEIAPGYTKKDLPEDKRKKLADGSVVVAIDELIADPTQKDHGFLYRLAHAVKAVENAYMARGGENPYIDYTKRELLHYKVDDTGEEYISDTGDPLIVGTTITLNDVGGWMTGYLEACKKKKAPTLTEWLQTKLEEKINAKHEDREKLRAIFNHFHLLDKVSRAPILKPMTPKEIGYLSPRVPRPVHVEKPVAEIPEDTTPPEKPKPLEEYDTTEVVLEDGETILLRKIPFTGTTLLSPEGFTLKLGRKFMIGNDRFAFQGEVESAGKKGKLAGSLSEQTELHRLFTPDEIERGTIRLDIAELKQDVEHFCKV